MKRNICLNVKPIIRLKESRENFVTQLINPHLLTETAVGPSQHVRSLNSHTRVLIHQHPRSGSETATPLPVLTYTPRVMCGNKTRGINLIRNYYRLWLALCTAALWKFKAFRQKLTQHELTPLESCTLLSSRLTELCPDSYQ